MPDHWFCVGQLVQYSSLGRRRVTKSHGVFKILSLTPDAGSDRDPLSPNFVGTYEERAAAIKHGQTLKLENEVGGTSSKLFEPAGTAPYEYDAGQALCPRCKGEGHITPRFD